MLDAVQQFFNRMLDATASNSTANRQVTLELATAALFCEIVRADGEIDISERDTLRSTLQSRFRLDTDAVDELMTMAQKEADEAVDHYQFVSLVNERYGYDDKIALVTIMWRLAYADGTLDPHEEMRVRKLADLLHLTHSDFIRTKLLVQDELSGGS
ncbi:tellurite resistance TerB family protein [Phytohalomonas tamaricis]|uniref:tellurite resistance TerB family protein n=1 Tax=Phytohalomonas tamaricis TaxID=2081032 RepID=UPI000D0ADFA4|nr:TerB family tellurite resistance protein [Phytohalomonas tamaricis]